MAGTKLKIMIGEGIHLRAKLTLDDEGGFTLKVMKENGHRTNKVQGGHKIEWGGGGNNCPDGPSRGGGVSKQEGEVGWGLGGASVESEEEMEMEVEEGNAALKPTEANDIEEDNIVEKNCQVEMKSREDNKDFME